MLVLEKSPEEIKRASELIHSGKVILWPSCGVYALACHAQIKEAVEKIYSIKSRNRNKPLPVVVNSKTAGNYGEINELGKKLVDKYWPGFLALVITKKSTIPDFVTAGIRSVALTCPNILASKLSYIVGAPIAVTSANISGKAEVLDHREAMKRFDGEVKAIIKGPRMPGVLNTILDLTQSPPKILREGGVPREDLKKIIPSL